MSDKKRISQVRPGSYVSLKKDFDLPDFYRGVSAGATGWVKKCKVDDYGFPMVFIKWDQKNHNWSGEKDKWTFESHFDVINDGKIDLNKNAEYIDILREASDQALGGVGFLLIAIREIPAGDDDELFLHSSFYMGSLEPIVEDLIEECIIDAAKYILEDKNNGDENEPRW